VFAGTCGGVAVTLTGHPFDTLKVRLQTQPLDKPIYNGMIDCARKTVQWEGLGGLYKGVASPLVGQMFFRASLFSAFGFAKRGIAESKGVEVTKLEMSDFYKAGAITGFVAAFTESPIDFFKSQIQVQIIRARSNPEYKPAFTSVSGAVRAAIQTNGLLRGPYQGFSATVIRNVPANCVYLGTFEALKSHWAGVYQCEVRDLPAHVLLGSAGFGGILFWLTTYPIDVIKSSMMCDTLDRSKRTYRSFLQTAQALYAAGGIRRFYVGFTPCLIRAAPANATMLYTVDKVTQFLS